MVSPMTTTLDRTPVRPLHLALELSTWRLKRHYLKAQKALAKAQRFDPPRYIHTLGGTIGYEPVILQHDLEYIASELEARGVILLPSGHLPIPN